MTVDTLRFRHRHLLGIEGLSREEITLLLDLSQAYVDQKRNLAVYAYTGFGNGARRRPCVATATAGSPEIRFHLRLLPRVPLRFRIRNRRRSD